MTPKPLRFPLFHALTGLLALASAVHADLTPADWQEIQATHRSAALEAAALGSGITQAAYLKASNTGTSDAFGDAVAISGDTIVIGAPGEASGRPGDQSDNSTSGSGAVYVYVRDAGGWRQQAYLKANRPASQAYFGGSVAISGDTIAIGASAEQGSVEGLYESGAVYIFVRQGETWTQQAYLRSANIGGGDQFGNAVALSGNTLVAGAHFEDSNATGVNGNGADNSASASGAAYIFVREGTAWRQEAYLKASNTYPSNGPESGTQFGSAVAISGDTVVIGAEREASGASGVNGEQNDRSKEHSGAAYVFERWQGNWSQQAYLKGIPSETYAGFGGAVAISGDIIAIGAQDHGTSSQGAAYVFTRRGGNWSPTSVLVSGNPGPADFFGSSVAISGSTILVGASYEHTDATGVDDPDFARVSYAAGGAYVFTPDGTGWLRRTYLKASNNNEGMGFFPGDRFGTSVAISGDYAVVGAVGEDSGATGINGNQTDESRADSGAAYLFTGLEQSADIGLTAELLHSPLIAGAPAVEAVRFSVTNAGPADASGLRLALGSTLPADGAIDAAAPSRGTFVNDSWQLDLPAGGQATLTLTIRANNAASSNSTALRFDLTAEERPLTDPDPSNDAATVAVPVLRSGMTPIEISTALAVDRQSGLLVQKITITNRNSGPVPAFILRAADLPEGVHLFNAANPLNPGADDEILYGLPLAAGESVTLTMEFFSDSRSPFIPRYGIELLPATPTPAAAAESGIAVTRSEKRPNGDFLIEIASEIGARYAVEYSEDLVHWTRASGELTASANRLQWIDNGPPKTASHPATIPARIYRFAEIPHDP